MGSSGQGQKKTWEYVAVGITDSILGPQGSSADHTQDCTVQ